MRTLTRTAARAVLLAVLLVGLASCSFLSSAAMPDEVKDAIAREAAVARSLAADDALTLNQARQYLEVNAEAWTVLEAWAFGTEGGRP